jgi:hypothetical protein
MSHSLKSVVRTGVFAVLASAALLSGPALARNLVTTAAGCSDEFKGSKGQINTCRACVDSGGRFKKSAAKKTWSCEGGKSVDGSDARRSK